MDAAEILNLDEQTIKTYNKRILEKAKSSFTYPFNNARKLHSI